jgi:lipopolysaccharide export system protein LptA
VLLDAQGQDAQLKKLSSFSLLPPGSELNDVTLPRYNENLQLSDVLRAKKMTLVDAEHISGEMISIGFFNPDGTQRGQVNLIKALLRHSAGILESHEKVILHSDRTHAIGNGLIYHLQEGKGFLLGPSTTWLEPLQDTTMNKASLKPIAVGVTAAILSVPATPAAEPTPATPIVHHQIPATDATTSKAVKDFLDKHVTNASPTPSTPTSPSTAQEPKPSLADTLIECDGGMYFDPDNGLFVYLKNVRVNDPRFSLDGADELKIYLEKKTQDPSKKDKPGKKFGDVERIVATGNVHMIQKKTAEVTEPAEANGASLVYEVKTGLATLSGGNLWGKRGQVALRAKEPNLSLRIRKTGHLITEGNWETIIVNQK